MKPTELSTLSRRERQIMDVLYRKGEASAQEVLDELPDPPGYSSIRALLARLVQKSLVTHRQQGAKYIYTPAVAKDDAQQTALKRLVTTFFEGSVAKAVNALLGSQAEKLNAEELADIQRALEQVEKQEKSNNPS